MAQAQLIDPFDFLGGQAQLPAPGTVGVEDVPDYQDPYAFLGVGPGAVTPIAQSARPASPAAFDWDYPRQIASGAALGFGAEIQGFENYMRGDGSLPLSSHVANARGAKESFEAAHPLGARPAEILGSVPTVVGANMLTPGLTGAMRSASLPMRMAGGALAGAEAGALQTKITGGEVLDNALMGAGLGAAMPGASGAIGKILTPRVDPGVIDIVRDMENLGVKLRPSQVAMSSALRRADEFFAGKGNESQIRDFTRAIGKTFGVDSPTLGPMVLENARKRITTGMDDVVQRTEILHDSDFTAGIAVVRGNTKGLKYDVKKQINDAITEVNNAFDVNGKITGEAYQNLTARGGVLMNMARDSNPAVRRAGGQLRDVLDDAIGRNSPAGTKEAWEELRSQYKNLITVQPLLEGSPTGLVDPKLLRARVKSMFDDYGWGEQNDLQTLATGGQLMPKLEATGGVKPGPLPWALRPSVLVPGSMAFGGAEMYLMMNHPIAAAGMAATAIGLGVAKAGVGAAMRGNAYRNALTGATPPPSWMTQGRLPALTGAVNSLNSLDKEEGQ